MLQRLRERVREARNLWRQRAVLERLPPSTVDATSLRPVGKGDLASAFAPKSAAGVEWADACRQIEQVVFIEDLKTAGVNPGDRRAIYHLIRALKPRRVLEVGTNVGASTLHIAAAMKRNREDDPSECQLVTVDIEDVNDKPDAYWKRANLPRSPRDNLAVIGMADCTTFIGNYPFDVQRDNSPFIAKSSLDYFAGSTDLFDFIFLDGSHAAAIVYQEVPHALRRLRPGGTILLHDYFPGHRPLWKGGTLDPGPGLAIARFKREGARIDAIPLGALPWPTKLGSNVTSLALLTTT